MTAQETDELTLKQISDIAGDVAISHPLIGDPSPTANLREVYDSVSAQWFRNGITHVSVKYSMMRSIRGDGNCFYRAYLYSYLETLLLLHNSQDETERALGETERDRVEAVIKASLEDLVSVGYDKYAIELFYDEVLELCTNLFSHTAASLLAAFLDESQGNCYIWFMRLLTAGYMKRHGDRFFPFVDGLYFDIGEYCKSEVEPMSKECEQLQVIALAECLGVPVNIVYLDGREFNESTGPTVLTLPEGSEGALASQMSPILLYRPGHYDILCK